MSNQHKFLIGLILGYVSYMFYKKYKGTETIMVDSFDTDMPNVIDPSTIAGLPHSDWN